MQGKCLFFRSHWKYSFLFIHMSKNINIWRKMSLLWDRFEKVVFCPYIREYQHVEINYVFLRSLWKKSFCPYIRKYLIEKIVFSPYIQKYQHFEENDVIMRSLWKSSFLSICPKISTFRGKLRYYGIGLKK